MKVRRGRRLVFALLVTGLPLATAQTGGMSGGASGTPLSVPSSPITSATTNPIATLRNNTQSAPGDANAWVDLGEGYLEAGRLDDAKESFLEAIAVDYLSGNAHFGLGLTEFKRGDLPAALFEFSEVTRLYPERFDGHFNRGVTLVRLRRADEAVDAFAEAVAQGEEVSGDDLVNAYLGLAGQLEVLGRFDEAAEAYAAALTIRPNDADLIYGRANALYRGGRGLEALPELTELEDGGGDYRVSALVADIYVEAGQVDYALRSLERALRKAAEETEGSAAAQADILVKLGLLQRDLGRDEAAVATFERAASTDPTAWEAFYNLGVSQLEAGRTQNALDTLQSALALNPESGELHLAIGTVYDLLGESQNALAEGQAAQQRLSDPQALAEAAFLTGRSLYRLGDYAGALTNLEAALAVTPDSAAAQLWAGLAAYGLEDYESAAGYYERAVQLEPNNIEAQVNLGAAYLVTERYTDAALVYDLLIQQNPEDAEAQYNLGWALFSQGKREEAKTAWRESLTLGYAPAGTALSEYF